MQQVKPQAEIWVQQVMVEKSTGPVRPFAGYTIGNRTTDCVTETGDVQAVLDHAASR